MRVGHFARYLVLRAMLGPTRKRSREPSIEMFESWIEASLQCLAMTRGRGFPVRDDRVVSTDALPVADARLLGASELSANEWQTVAARRYYRLLVDAAVGPPSQVASPDDERVEALMGRWAAADGIRIRFITDPTLPEFADGVVIARPDGRLYWKAMPPLPTPPSVHKLLRVYPGDSQGQHLHALTTAQTAWTAGLVRQANRRAVIGDYGHVHAEALVRAEARLRGTPPSGTGRAFAA